jgi:hypothetical protein
MSEQDLTLATTLSVEQAVDVVRRELGAHLLWTGEAFEGDLDGVSVMVARDDLDDDRELQWTSYRSIIQLEAHPDAHRPVNEAHQERFVSQLAAVLRRDHVGFMVVEALAVKRDEFRPSA